MGLSVPALTNALISLAGASGFFAKVNGHEPKAAPVGRGITAAVWLQSLAPAVGASSLESTAMRLEYRLRLYQSMLREPQDAIDPDLLAAADAMLAAFSGDFTLGGEVRNVDLLGQHGTPLSLQAGYVPMDGGKLMRILDIIVPLIINDVYEQGE
jgi:hypothetical protein